MQWIGCGSRVHVEIDVITLIDVGDSASSDHTLRTLAAGGGAAIAGWHWHLQNIQFEVSSDYRIGIFKGEIPDIQELSSAGYSFLTWGRKIDHASARAAFSRLFPTGFVAE